MFVYRVINFEFNRIGQSKEYRMDKTTRGSTRFTVFLFKFGLKRDGLRVRKKRTSRLQNTNFMSTSYVFFYYYYF